VAGCGHPPRPPPQPPPPELDHRASVASTSGTKAAIFDSGATATMHNRRSAYTGPLSAHQGVVHLGDDSPVPSIGRGETSIGRALLVPDLTRPLISTGQDDKNGLFTLFGGGKVVVIDAKPSLPPHARIVRRGHLTCDGVYELAISPRAASASISEDTYTILHAITHFSPTKLNRMIERKTALGLPLSPISRATCLAPCTDCVEGKMRKPTVGSVVSRGADSSATRGSAGHGVQRQQHQRFELVGVDLVDLGTPAGRRRWAGVFLDLGTDMGFVYYAARKSDFLERMLRPFLQEAASIVSSYPSPAPASGGVPAIPVKFQSDGDKAFWTTEALAALPTGTSVQKSAPYTQAQNGRVEEMIGIVKDGARTLMLAAARESGAEVPPKFRADSMTYANNLRNSAPTASDPYRSPMERCTGSKPDFSKMAPFWDKGWAHEPKALRDETGWAAKGIPCRILGAAPGHKDTQRVVLTRRGKPTNRVVNRYKVMATRTLPTFASRSASLRTDTAEQSAPQASSEPSAPPAPSASLQPSASLEPSALSEPSAYLEPLVSLETFEPRQPRRPHGSVRFSEAPDAIQVYPNRAGIRALAPYRVLYVSSEEVRASRIQAHREGWRRGHPPPASFDAPAAQLHPALRSLASPLPLGQDAATPLHRSVSFSPIEPAQNTVHTQLPFTFGDFASSLTRKAKRSPPDGLGGGDRASPPAREGTRGRATTSKSRGVKAASLPAVDGLRRSARTRPLPATLRDRAFAARIAAKPRGLSHEKTVERLAGIARRDEAEKTGRPMSWHHATAKARAHVAKAQAEVRVETEDLPPVPRDLDEALAGPNAAEWAAAVATEKAAIAEHGTYEPAPDWKGRTVKSKLVFRVTREPDGTFKFKARLVAQGFSEKHGVDYFETFAPTIATRSLHALLHIAATEGRALRHIDVAGAYLESPIDTVLYMRLPLDLTGGVPVIVRLLKSIYGLKQSGELWNRRLDSILQGIGYKRSHSDPCVYILKQAGGVTLYLCVYVDDILVIGPPGGSTVEMEAFEAAFAAKVSRIKSGPAIRFVGIDFSRDLVAKTITLRQQVFIADLLKSEGMAESRPKSNPGSALRNLPAAARDEEPEMRSLVGKVRYLVDHTRPESLYIASQLSSAAASPGVEHVAAGQHLLRYFAGTVHQGLTLGGPGPIVLEGWVDASLVEEGESLSQLGYCWRLNRSSGMAFSRSMRDKHVSLSSAEAELRALSELAKDIIWAREFLAELGFRQRAPTVCHEDNSAVIDLCATVKVNARTKHLTKVLNFVRSYIRWGALAILKVPGEDNVADVLTKPLATPLFRKHCATLIGSG
jgi:hypothetical protein